MCHCFANLVTHAKNFKKLLGYQAAKALGRVLVNSLVMRRRSQKFRLHDEFADITVNLPTGDILRFEYMRLSNFHAKNIQLKMVQF